MAERRSHSHAPRRLIDRDARRNDERHILSDVTQLRGFYDYLDSGTFLPFLARTSRPNGRLMRSITSVAKNVAEGLPQSASARSTTGRQSDGSSR